MIIIIGVSLLIRPSSIPRPEIGPVFRREISPTFVVIYSLNFMLWIWFLAQSMEWCDGRFCKKGNIYVTGAVLLFMNLILAAGSIRCSIQNLHRRRHDAARKHEPKANKFTTSAKQIRNQAPLLELRLQRTDSDPTVSDLREDGSE